MDNFNRDLEDLLNMTDTDDESSSSSNAGVFENSHPYVLELHELQKDEPGADVPAEEVKRKKKEKRKKKKREANEEQTSDTSSNLSNSVPNVPTETTREEFYDAHESYHALPENQASPTAALVLAQVHSEQVHDPKVVEQRTTSETSATPREPSTINKPVSNPPQ